MNVMISFALAYLLKSQDRFKINAITIAPFSLKNKVNVKDSQKLSYSEVNNISNMLNFITNNRVFNGSTNYISKGYQEENSAVKKIIEIALKNKKTYILAIGALTNVALAIKYNPKIINRIEVIWLGGNSFLQDNNLEFNFKQDVEAIRIVFDSKVN